MTSALTFDGYARPDGSVGVRNHVLVLSVTGLTGPTARRIGRIVGGTRVIATPYGSGLNSAIDVVGRTHTEEWRANFQLCSEDYFPTLQLRTRLGRTLSETEVRGARKVAVVNQTFANKFLGDENPIGRMVKINMLESVPDSPVKDPFFEVIGVISDAKNQGLQNSPMPEIFTRPIPSPGTKSYCGPLTSAGDVRLSFVELYDMRAVVSKVGVKMCVSETVRY